MWKRLSIASAALVAATTVELLEALPCTSVHLAAFKETTIAAPVNKCMSASEVKFSMPPTADLTETQRDQICGERVCKDMIASIDDMEIPRCDLLYNGKNVTLQASLDRFTAICDAPRSVAPEVKKRTAKKSDSTSAAARFATSPRYLMVVVGSLGVIAAWVF